MEYKDSSLLTVLTISVNDPTLNVIADANLQNTDGNILLPDVPVKDTVMKDYVKKLQDTYTGFKASPPLFTEPQVTKIKKLVVASYNQNGGYVQGIARLTVIATGSITDGITLIKGSGFYIKDPKSPSEHSFKLKNAGPGSVDVSTLSPAKRAGFIRAYGATTGYDIPPTVIKELLVTLEGSINVSGLKRTTVYGFREAVVLPVPRKKKPTTPISTEKLATPTVAGKAHKIIFNDNDETHYVWGPWQYITTT